MQKPKKSSPSKRQVKAKNSEKNSGQDDDYDYEDDFIDDDDLFFRPDVDVGNKKREWKYGFFACKGSIDDVLTKG